jgi:hypothetical protein
VTIHDAEGTHIRVVVSEQYMFAQDTVDIIMGYKIGETYRVMRIVDGRCQFEEVTGPVTIEPTMLIPRDFALALCTALSGHFNGTPDTHMLRADLDVERKRVDRLIGVVGDALDKVLDRLQKRQRTAIAGSPVPGYATLAVGYYRPVPDTSQEARGAKA